MSRESPFALPPAIQYTPIYEPLPVEAVAPPAPPAELRPPAPAGVEFRAPEEELLSRSPERVLLDLAEVRTSATVYLQVIREEIADPRFFAYERGELDAAGLIYQVATDAAACSALELVPFLTDIAEQAKARQDWLSSVLTSLKAKLPGDIDSLCQKALGGEILPVATRFLLGALSLETGFAAHFADWSGGFLKQSLPLVLQTVPETVGLSESAPAEVAQAPVAEQASKLYTHLLSRIPPVLREQAEKLLRSLCAESYTFPEEESTEKVLSGWLAQQDEGEPQARIKVLATRLVGGDHTVASIDRQSLLVVGKDLLGKLVPAIDILQTDLGVQGTQAAFNYFQVPNLFAQSSSLLDILRGKLETLLPVQEVLTKLHEQLGDSPWLASLAMGANQAYQQYVETNTDRLRADAYRFAAAEGFCQNLEERHQLRLVRSRVIEVM